MIVGLVVALPEEIATLTDKSVAKGHCVFINRRVLVAYSGAGGQNAQRAAELLVAKGVTHLVSWGCAAGLSPMVRPGDLVLPEFIVDSEGAKITIDTEVYRHSKSVLSKVGGNHGGGLLTSSHLVSSAKEKNQLHVATGAIALDMESMAVAQVAKQRVLPFLAVRAIADPATSGLPRAVSVALNDQGDIVMAKLLLSILRCPLDIPRLIRLGWQFRKAKMTLKQVALHLDDLFVAKPNITTS